MMNNNPRPASDLPPRRPVFDVVRPGRTPASPTSRPVINARSPVQDTSITVNSPKTPPAPMPKQSAPPVSSIDFKPQQAKPVFPAPAAPRPVTPAPPVPAPKPIQPQQQATARQDVGRAGVDSQMPQAPAPAPYAEESEAPVAQEARDAAPPRRSILSEVLAVFAIILLIAIIVNILLDAQIIDLPLPHTNFFDY